MVKVLSYNLIFQLRLKSFHIQNSVKISVEVTVKLSERSLELWLLFRLKPPLLPICLSGYRATRSSLLCSHSFKVKMFRRGLFVMIKKSLLFWRFYLKHYEHAMDDLWEKVNSKFIILISKHFDLCILVWFFLD